MNIIDSLLGRQDELIPPKETIFGGDGDFKKIGEEFLRHFIELGGLGPSERVLDVGCGIGRMASPLTKYLNKRGSYEGFDIVSKGVNWCKENISLKYPNFNFQLADVFNKHYNPDGKHKASEYKFPYEDNSFDFVFLTSVFTHMLPDDLENYLKEISRVMKKGGRCLITYFLLNDESIQLINDGKTTFNVGKNTFLDFKHHGKGYRTIDEHTPEHAVAYDEKFILKLYGKYNLTVMEPIRYGSWCGRKDFLSYQDIIIASRG